MIELGFFDVDYLEFVMLTSSRVRVLSVVYYLSVVDVASFLIQIVDTGSNH